MKLNHKVISLEELKSNLGYLISLVYIMKTFFFIYFTDGSPRCDLGGHQNFVETSKALIKNTNARIERVHIMSNHLRYLASQIKDDRDDAKAVQLSPNVKRISDIKRDNKSLLLNRHSLNIVIPVDGDDHEQHVGKSARGTRTTTQKHCKQKYRNMPLGKKDIMVGKVKAQQESLIEQECKMTVEIPERQTSQNDANAETCDTKLPSLERQLNTAQPKQEGKNTSDIKHEETALSGVKLINATEENNRDGESVSSRHQSCSFLDKLTTSKRGNNHDKVEKIFKNGIDHRKITERLRAARLASSAPSEIKTNVVDINLQTRAISQYFPGNSPSNMYNSNHSYLYKANPFSLSQKPNTANSKTDKQIVEIRQQGNTRFQFRTVLLPKKVTIQAKNVSELIGGRSVTALEDIFLGCRFRVGQNSNVRSKSDTSGVRMKHFNFDSQLILKPGVS